MHLRGRRDRERDQIDCWIGWGQSDRYTPHISSPPQRYHGVLSMRLRYIIAQCPYSGAWKLFRLFFEYKVIYYLPND